MERHPRQPLAEPPGHRGRERFAATHHLRQAGAAPRLGVLQEELQHRGDEARRADRLAPDGLHQATRVADVLRPRQHDAAARHQRPEDLARGDVEAERRVLQHRLARFGPPRLPPPRQPVDHAAVLVHHALGLPRGARGVDHVHQVIGGELRDLGVPGRTALPLRPRIQVDHRDREPPEHSAHRTGQPRLRQHRGRGAVRQHVAQPGLGVRRVQRDVCASGLEHRQQPHHHLRAPLHADGDARIRPHATLAEVVRQPVGAGVQLRVRQREILEDHGHGAGRALHLRLEELVDAQLARMIGLRPVPLLHHPAPLVLREQLEPMHPPCVVGDEPLQHPAQVAQPALDGGPLEQRRRVRHAPRDPPAPLPQRERQVELRRGPVRARHAHRRRRGPRQPPAPLRRAVPAEHHLYQRAVRQAAGGVHPLHHLFERDVLAILRPQRALLHPPQQLRHGRRAGEVHAQRQRVDEEADQPLDLLPLTVGRGGAYHHVGAAREPAEHHRPPREHRHEQRGPVALGERPEPRGKLLAQVDRHRGSGVVLPRRTRAVGGELQQLRRAGERAPPVLRLRLQDVPLQPPPLPRRVVRVLHRERREGIGLAPSEGVVQRAHLAGEHPHAPFVGDDVVHGDEQHVVVGRQPDQPAADQRPALQVERRARFLGDQRAQLRPGLRVSGEVVVHQPEGALLHRSHPLHRLAVHLGEGGAQRLVAGHDPVQRARQRLPVQLARQAHTRGDVIRDSRGPELFQEPEPLLRERQRQRAAALHRLDGRRRLAALEPGGPGELQQSFRIGNRQSRRHGAKTRVAVSGPARPVCVVSACGEAGITPGSNRRAARPGGRAPRGRTGRAARGRRARRAWRAPASRRCRAA